MNIQVNVNSAAARVSSHRVQAGAGSKNQGLRLKAQKFVKYELVDDATGFAPENIATKRVGEDLHIAFEKSDIAAPDLVIEGYYDEPGTAAIIGKAESGVYYNYVPESGLRSEAVSMLGDGTFAGQALGGEQFSMPLWLASSAVSPAAVLLGGLLLSGIAAAGGSGSTGGIPAPSPGPQNNAPIAPDQRTSTLVETPLSGRVLGSDVDGDTLTYDKGRDPAHGTLVVNPDGSFTYTPNENYRGPDSFTVIVRDGKGGVTTSTINVEVTPVNKPPIATDDSTATPFETPLNGINVLGNDRDPDGDPLTVSGASVDAGKGTVTINPDGTLNFIPGPGVSGHVTITYTITDGNGGTDTAILTVTVGAENVPAVLEVTPGMQSEGYSLVHTVTLSGTSSKPQTYEFSISDVTTDPSDWGAPIFSNGVIDNGDGTITVPAGVGSFDVSVPALRDTISEPSESYTINVGGQSSIGTIFDLAPPLSVAVSDAAPVSEGSNLVYTVTLTGGTASTDITIPVTYTGTAADGNDYTSVASVTILAGQTTGTLTVPTNTDTVAEGDETVIVNLGTPSLEGVIITDGTASGTIKDVAPALSVAINGTPSVNEGGDLVYTVTLTGGTASTDITIPVTYTGTAADGSDYTGVANVTILAGQTTGTLTVPTNTDTIAEGDETVVVTLGTPSLAGVTVVDGEASGTITDVAPTLTVSIADAPSVNEGGDLVYTVTLTGGTSATDITIPVTYTGTAADGSDYTSVASVTIPAGETTGTLTVPTLTDSVAEGDETVVVTLGTPSLAGVTVVDGEASGTITDVAPTLTVSISDAPSVNEGGDLVYTVTLTGGTSATDITIPVTYTGTAADGSDYTSVANVTIPAGETTGTLTVPTNTDTVAEGDETVVVTLGTPSLAGVTVVDGEASGTITDVAPTLTVSISDAPSVNEGGDLVYTVTLTGGTSATDITIPVTYTGTAADGSDYTSVASVTIPAGETTGTLTVPTNTDTIAEGDETVIVTLGTPSLAGVTVVDGEASGTITDVAPALTVSIADAPSVNEGGDLVYTVTLTGGTSATDITIPVTYTGTAADGSDYTSVASVTILAGQTTGTLTVPTNTDTVAEGDETVIVNLGTPSLAGVTVTEGSATGTIKDVAPSLSVSISDAPSVNEGGDLVYTVTLTGGTSATDITIPVTYTGTAADGSDYTSVASVTIPAGETTGTLTVPTNTDTVAEGDETVIVTLGTPSLAGVPVVDGEASGTITDVAPTLTVSIADAPSVNEGGDLVYTVTLTGGTASTDITIPVTYTGTAADGSDYTSVANVTIPAGETTGTLTVPTNTDTIAEGDETVIVTLGTPSLAGVTVVDGEASGTITDVAPTLTVSISDAPSVNEGGDLVYTVTLTGGTSATDITIPVTYTGTAADGSDYTSVASVTIPAGETTGTLTVPTNTDTVAEGDETVIVNLGTPSLAGVTVTEGSATGTIKDVAPSLSVSISDAPSVNEGGDLVYTVTLTGGTSATDITIPVTYTGTAADGSDYTSVANVTIPAGETTGTLTVPTNTDTVAEGDETVVVTLGTPSLAGVTVVDGEASGTITDVAPTLTVSISDAPSVNEGGDLVYTVTLTGGTSATDITIPVTYTGTAADGSDYTSVANVTIPAGETTGTLTVPTNTDTIAEGDETVVVTLGTPSLSGVTVVDGEASGTITDVAPTLTVSISDAPSVNEGGDLVYTVTLTGGTSATDITIPVTYTGTAADGSDYTSVASVTIPAGETTGTLTVPTNTDTIAEGDETVIVTLGTPSLAGVTVVDGEASGTITDVAPTLTVSIADAPSVNEGGDLVYTVTLTGGTSATDITIPVTYTGTAADGSDYTSVASVTIPAGETTGTLTVPTNTDTIAEGDETVIVTLGTPSLAGVTVVDGEASGTITDVAPTLTVSISDAPSVNEGGDLVYTVTLTGGTSATDITIPVTYTGTAADGSDYTSVASVTIPAGETTGTLTVPTNTDTIAEGDETVIVTLGTPSLAGVTVVDGEASGTITDVAPALTVSIADAPSVNEGGDLVYTVTLTGGTSATDITIPVTYTGTAADGSDYTSVASVTILAGQTTGTLTVPTNTDTVAEGDETVIVNLGTPSLAGVTVTEGSATGTIKDVAPSLSVSISDAPSVNEGGDLVYTVTLTGGTSATDITIPLVYGGTASSGTDYTAGPTSVTIPAGSTSATVTVVTIPDSIAEGNETVTVGLGSPPAGVTVTVGAATGTIIDDDTAPVFEDPNAGSTPPGVNDPGTIFTPSVGEQPSSYTISYNENSLSGSQLGRVKATDLDGGTVTYAFAGTVPGGATPWYAINATTGVITLTAAGQASLANDYEDAGGLNSRQVVVRASDGTNTTDIVVTLQELDVPENSPPTISSVTSATVSEEGLTGGIADSTGTPTDTTNSVSATGTISITDASSSAEQLTVALSGPASGAIKSGGVNVVWTWDAATMTLTGKAGATSVMTIAVGSVTGSGGSYSAGYTATLLKPIDHATGGTPGIEDVLNLGFSATVTDNTSLSHSSSFTVSVEDDMPVAQPSSQSYVLPSQNSNILLVLDVSWSMREVDAGATKSRLEIMKDAVKLMLDAYDALGDVSVRIVTFGVGANAYGSTWVSVSDAKTYVGTLTADSYGTHYSTALTTAQTAYASEGKIAGANNVAYFLTDGAPTANYEITSALETTWTSFLNTNDINAFAYGMGPAAPQSPIDPAAYDGRSSGTNTNAIVVADTTQLPPILRDSVGANASGSVITGSGGFTGDSELGADGGSLNSVTVNGRTYGADGAVTGGTSRGSWNSTTFTWTISTESSTGNVSEGGKLVIRMDDGTYTYTPPIVLSSGTHVENFGFSLIDRDGDTAASTLTLTVYPAGTVLPKSQVSESLLLDSDGNVDSFGAYSIGYEELMLGADDHAMRSIPSTADTSEFSGFAYLPDADPAWNTQSGGQLVDNPSTLHLNGVLI